MSVLVFLENWDGKFKKLSFELVSYATKVAEMQNLEVIALSIGNVDDSELQKLATYGASKIISIDNAKFSTLDDQAYTRVISEVAEKNAASVVLLSNNNSGKAIASRVAIRLKAGLASGVSQLPLSLNPFIVYKKVYSGKAFSHVKINSTVKVLTLAQNSFEVIEAPKNASIEKSTITPDENLFKIELKEVQKQTGKILLTDAEIVVSGGRGMKSPLTI